MDDRDRLIVTEATEVFNFNKLDELIARNDVDPDLIRFIIRQLDKSKRHAILSLQLLENER